MKNINAKNIQYTVEQTPLGVWNRYHYPTGDLFADYKTHKTLFGWPLFHYTRGLCPETGVHRVAKGVLAIGKCATGGVAIGQAAFGGIAIGQLAVGVVFGFGQACTGVFALGQLALAVLLGFGQAATGYVAIGQFGFGEYALAQFGFGSHIWDSNNADPTAVAFFETLPAKLTEWWRFLRIP